MIRLWLVGKINLENYKEWEFQGVFTDEIKASAICIDESYFIGPLILSEIYPDESVDWPGAYYLKCIAKEA